MAGTNTAESLPLASIFKTYVLFAVEEAVRAGTVSWDDKLTITAEGKKLGSSGFDKALGASPYTALNLDVGHYFGVTGESPVPIIEKYHDRIASLHLKDRKAPGPNGGGANVPWGQGGTPLKEILQTMKQKKFKFPGSIEYEYNTPEGSSVVAEVKKCVDYCRAALA